MVDLVARPLIRQSLAGAGDGDKDAAGDRGTVERSQNMARLVAQVATGTHFGAGVVAVATSAGMTRTLTGVHAACHLLATRSATRHAG